MRLPDDDELYEVDQTYLGPPGRYIGAMRHKTIFSFLVVCPLVFVLARKIGVSMSLLSVGLLLLLCIYVSQLIADHVSQEKPLFALLTTGWHDLTATRSDERPYLATGEGFDRLANPTGSVGRWHRRQGAPTTYDDKEGTA